MTNRDRPLRSRQTTSRFFLLLLLTCLPSLKAQSPRWIWVGKDRVADATATFRRAFVAQAPLQNATLSGVADFCQITVKINGDTVSVVGPYENPFQIDCTRQLREGDNLLEVEAESISGPAAFAMRLDLGPRQSSEQLVVTDASWKCTLASEQKKSTTKLAIEFGEVTEFELDPRRQLSISAVDDYEQWRQALSAGQGTDPASFVATPGFEIDLVRSATPDEGSWVSMAFDPRGRLIIAREDRGLLRMTLTEDKRSVARVETVNETLNECRGLLFAHDKLYVNANNSKGLYQLSDRGGTDRLEDVRLLRQFDGGVGHGRNDLALGPDGMIYSINGDSVDLPKDCEDWTSPFREHRRGKKTSEGYVIRTDAEGKRWQIVAAGLRNPFGIAFNPDGELFTYDADAEFDMGSPWYRPTQVKHLVAGADFGWRGVTGKWPPYYPDHPDNAFPSVHIGKGSPTSVQFGTRSHFPPPYRDALFILDWAYGRIVAVHLTARGASYGGKAETFLKGRPLNVTDLDFGPEGAMYFVTGGRKTQAALYRVRYVGSATDPPALSIQQQARLAHAADARRLRHELETLLHGDAPGNHAIEKAWSHLGHADPSIRYAARTAVEHQPIHQWKEKALGEKSLPVKLTALLCLARNGDGSAAAAILEQLNRIPLRDLTPSQKVSALYTTELCFRNKDQITQPLLQETQRQLDAIYPDASSQVNQYLSLLLVDLKSPNVLAKTLSLLDGATNQAEQMHYLFALRTIATGWSASQREAFLRSLARANEYQGGEGMPGFLRRIREDFVATMNAQEKEQFATLLSAKTVEQELPPARPLVKQWTLAELHDLAAKRDDQGDWESGKRMFAAAACSHCHRVGTIGQLVGPDLSGVGSRFSRRDILQSILDPSAVVAENYQNDRVETADGRVLVGRLIESSDFRSTALKVVTDPLRPDQAIEIVKKEIVSHDKVPTSPMPAGLLNTLTKDEIRNLLLFVESGGKNRNH